CSYTVMFLPISLSPPRGIIFIFSAKFVTLLFVKKPRIPSKNEEKRAQHKQTGGISAHRPTSLRGTRRDSARYVQKAASWGWRGRRRGGPSYFIANPPAGIHKKTNRGGRGILKKGAPEREGSAESGRAGGRGNIHPGSYIIKYSTPFSKS